MTGARGRCSPCAVNFYRDDSAEPREPCFKCPQYSYTLSLGTDSIAGCLCLKGARRNSSADKSDGYRSLCVSCPAGYSADPNSAEGLCSPCLSGTYRTAEAVPDQPCIACPPNTRSPNNASTLLSDCLCVPGCALGLNLGFGLSPQALAQRKPLAAEQPPLPLRRPQVLQKQLDELVHAMPSRDVHERVRHDVVPEMQQHVRRTGCICDML